MSIFPKGTLAYGMQLPIQTKTQLVREPWEEAAGTAELLAVAKKAEQTGHTYIGVCDHVAIPTDEYASHMGTTWYDPIATLGFLAAATSTIRLMSTVYIPVFRHPLISAKSFMTLDSLSNGRIMLGVGTGHLRPEFDGLGVNYSSRGRDTSEAIEAIRTAIATEWSSFSGERWSWRNLGLAPRPVQTAIPIWIGGWSKAAFRRVAELGDGWLPQLSSRTDTPAAIMFMEEHRKTLRPDAEIDYGFVAEWIHVGKPKWELGDAPHLTGSPESIAESLREVRDLGCSHMQLHFRSRTLDELLDQMDAFGRDVAPHLND